MYDTNELLIHKTEQDLKRLSHMLTRITVDSKDLLNSEILQTNVTYQELILGVKALPLTPT